MTMGLFGFRNQVVRLSLYARTDVGRARDHNEDNFMVADLTMRRPILTPEVREHLVGDKGSILVVADGMGGAAAGELASAMAAGIIYEQLRATWIESRRSDFRSFLTFIQQSIETANHEIHQRSLGEPGLSGMGTTLTAAGILGDRIGFAQIGDSRAYLIRKGQVEQVTRDQSLTRRLIDEGKITEAEAESSPGRNIILQALGPRPSVEVAISERNAARGDILVLCSDGLSGVVSSEEILEVVSGNHNPAVSCEGLVDLANSRGGPDNITVIVARLDGPGLKEP
jgi:PPM family protein phosphatase